MLLLPIHRRSEVLRKSLITVCLTFFIIVLQACSGTPLQTKRLNEAENHIVLAEQSISNPRNINYTQENIGSAKAFLATVNDFKKFLSKVELSRLNALNTRLNSLEKRVRQ